MMIRKLFHAEIAHRVLGADSIKCHGLHGHSYAFEVFLQGQEQNQAQMLIDFTVVKNKLKPLIQSFDHSLLIWEKDVDLIKIAEILNPRYLILPYNPTAEQISRHIYYFAELQALPIYKVVVHETATGYAEFTGDDEIAIDLKKVIYSQTLQEKFLNALSC